MEIPLKKYVLTLTALLSAALQAQTFKGHQIGESTADFLKSEPALQAKLAECQATAPRELTNEEAKKIHGRKAYDRRVWDEAVYNDKCGALVDALVTGDGYIDGNGYAVNNIYSQMMWKAQQDRLMSGDYRPGPRLPSHIEINQNNRFFYFDNGALSALALSVASAYEPVRDDVTSRLGADPKEDRVPYHSAFGATWNDITATWDTEKLRVELFQAGNPAKPSLPHLSVRSRAVYRKALERSTAEPTPLD